MKDKILLFYLSYMLTIEINDVKINVPQGWDDITLGTYEQVFDRKPESARDRVALVAQVCGIDAATLLNWPAEVFNIIVENILFLYGENPAKPSPLVEIGGVKYLVPVEDEISLGAWVDADEAQKAGVNVLSNVLAIVCRPAGEVYDYKNNEARQKLFASQPASKIMGVLAFFLHCKQQSERLTAAYGKLHQVADLLPRNTEILRNLGAGTKLLRMWRIIRFYYLTRLLRSQLRKFSPYYNTARIKSTPKTGNAN